MTGEHLENIVAAVVAYKPTAAELLELQLNEVKRDLEQTRAKLLKVLSILEGREIKADWFAVEIATRTVSKQCQ